MRSLRLLAALSLARCTPVAAPSDSASGDAVDVEGAAPADVADAPDAARDAPLDRTGVADRPDGAEVAPDGSDAAVDRIVASADGTGAGDAATDSGDATAAELPAVPPPTWPEARVGSVTSWSLRLPSTRWALAAHAPAGAYLAGGLSGAVVTVAYDPGGRPRWRAAFSEDRAGTVSIDASAAGAIVAAQPSDTGSRPIRLVRYTPVGAVAAHRRPEPLSCIDQRVQLRATGAAELLCTNVRNVPVDGHPVCEGHPSPPFVVGCVSLLSLRSDLGVASAASWPWVEGASGDALFAHQLNPHAELGDLDRAGEVLAFSANRLVLPSRGSGPAAQERGILHAHPLTGAPWEVRTEWPAPSFSAMGSYRVHGAVWRVAVTPAGEVYAAIATKLPVVGQTPITDADTRDIVLAAYNRSGTLRWTRRYGSSGDDTLGGVAVTEDGEVALTGSFSTPFSTGAGALTSAGGRDAFVLLVGADGAPRAAQRFGGVGDDEGTAVAAAGRSDVFVLGTFTGTGTFLGGSLTAAPGEGAFLARYGASCAAALVACGDRCVDAMTDVANCGACAAACDLANAAATCAAGRCVRGACNAGFGDCDGRADNGCEAHTGSDPAHCGACGRRCAAGESCRASRCCAGAACPPDPFPSDGSEGAFAPTRDVTLAAGIHQFTWIRVPAGVTVRSEASAVLELRARGPVEIAGAIEVSGASGGRPSMHDDNIIGGAGGAWGGGSGSGLHSAFGPVSATAGTGPGGGAGGTDTTPPSGGSPGGAALADLPARSTFARGSGGGGGGGPIRAWGDTCGGGGGAGGALRVASPERIVLAATARLRADGGAPGPGGGGGSGGVVYLASPELRVAGGAEVSAAGGNAPGGVAGGVGRVRISTARATCTLDGRLTPPATASCATSPAAGTPGFAYVGAWPN